MQVAYVSSDELPKKTGVERHNKSFEIANNDFLTTVQPTPSHLWIVSAEGGVWRRLTSGAWTLPISFPLSPPAAPLSWTRDGKSVVIVKVASPYSGDFAKASVQVLDVAAGTMRALTGRSRQESFLLVSARGKFEECD